MTEAMAADWRREGCCCLRRNALGWSGMLRGLSGAFCCAVLWIVVCGQLVGETGVERPGFAERRERLLRVDKERWPAELV
jgi:hypothetical protein